MDSPYNSAHNHKEMVFLVPDIQQRHSGDSALIGCTLCLSHIIIGKWHFIIDSTTTYERIPISYQW